MRLTSRVEDPTSLSGLPTGHSAIVEALRGGHAFRARIANLGFTPGAMVRMVQNYGHGPVIVSLKGTLVALGRGEAAHVRVQEADIVRDEA